MSVNTYLSDLDKERALIGVLLKHNAAINDVLAVNLRPLDFAYDETRIAFECFVDFHANGKAFDPFILSGAPKFAELADAASSDDASAIGMALNLDASAARAGLYNAQLYALDLIELRKKRDIVKVSERAAKLAFERESTSESVYDQLVGDVLRNVNETHDARISEAHDIALDVLQDSETAVDDPERITLKTGFKTFDEHVQLERGELVYLAARPGMGKTALQLELARRMSMSGYRCLFFSAEMKRDALVRRIIASRIEAQYKKVSAGSLTDEQWAKYHAAVAELKTASLRFPAETNDVQRIFAQAQVAKLERGLDVIFIDYAQLLDAPGASLNERNTVISNTIKRLTTTLDCAVVCAAQLSRGVESRANKVPQLSDLRDSGSYEQDADQVWFLYRDEYYNRVTTDRPNVCEIHIAKNRNGALGQVDLYFDESTVRFSDLEREIVNLEMVL